MSSTRVSDQVWANLDRDAARPIRRARRVIAALAAVATFAAVVVAFGFISGLFRPRTWLETRWIDHVDRSAHAFTYTFAIHNTDWVDEKLIAVASTNAAIRTRLDAPLTIGHGDTYIIAVRATVLDCGHVPANEPPLRLHFDRVWGEVTQTVRPVPVDPTRSDEDAQIFMAGAPYYVCHGAAG